jgi:hypothetical protein
MPSQSLARFIDVPALLVQARYRGRPLASRLLSAGERRGFAVGAARGADAPVDAAFIEVTPGNDNHLLVQPSGGGFLINLSPAMRSLSDGADLRVACGEVVFELSAAASPPAVPRPWLSARARDLAPYLAGVGLALAVVVALLRMVPSDARALSLDDLGRNVDVRLDAYRILPPVSPPSPPAATRGGAGGGAPRAASGPEGEAGDRRAPPSPTRHASKRSAERQDERTVAQYVESNTMLAVLRGEHGQAFKEVFSKTPALGRDAADVLSHLEGQTIASAYGPGLGARGTGAGGADTGLPLIGGAPGLRTIGKGGGNDGVGPGYGDRGGRLRTRAASAPVFVPSGPIVRGGLDKEIVRRVVRQHLNEVRFCYEQSLARRPSLAGRVVASFSIAPTGRVLSSVLQSSTLGEPTVEACIVGAVRRWGFPAPAGGGVVIVSYPFQLTPAGA